jgi:hypothetical protein
VDREQPWKKLSGKHRNGTSVPAKLTDDQDEFTVHRRACFFQPQFPCLSPSLSLYTPTMNSGNREKRSDVSVTIAQTTFRQALKKLESSDASLPIVTDEVSNQFCSALDAVLQQNTPANIQVST